MGSLLKNMFTANLIKICRAYEAGPRLAPVVDLYAKCDNVEVQDDDYVAIIHILGTWSFHAIFLKPDMTIVDVERKVRRGLEAELNLPSREALESFLMKLNNLNQKALKEAR